MSATISQWTDDELTRVGDAVELQLASRRADGTLRPFTTMWVARAGDDMYVRSAGGPDRPWYRHALTSGAGRILAGGLTSDVTFSPADRGVREELDAAYQAKYDRFGSGPVGHVTGPAAHSVTIRLDRSQP
jgi:hypothetical protein